MALSTIKIPEKVYIGFQGRRTQDEVPLGFMTPFTTDAAGQKRRNSVDSWAAGYGREKTFNSVTLENKPMIGFKVGRSIRRSGGWNGSGASYIRIEDPRGFELEISIENLAMCMNGNLIEDGEIIQECVWGRDGGRNILLPINSEPFKDSVTTSSKIDNAVSIRLVNPGDKIKLISGDEYTYMGLMCSINVNQYNSVPELQFGKKKHVIKHTDKHGITTYATKASLKIDKIIEAKPVKMSPTEVDTEMTLAMQSSTCVFEDSSTGWRVYTRGFMVGDVRTIINQSQVDYTEMEIKSNIKLFDTVLIMVEDKHNKHLVADWDKNFITNRNEVGRHYNTYAGGGYFRHYNRTEVLSDGFIGKLATVDGTTVSKNIDISDSQMHIENTDINRLFVINIEIKSKSDVIFNCML